VARGDRSADGGDLTAEEIVSGTFRNLPAPSTPLTQVLRRSAFTIYVEEKCARQDHFGFAASQVAA